MYQQRSLDCFDIGEYVQNGMNFRQIMEVCSAFFKKKISNQLLDVYSHGR